MRQRFRDLDYDIYIYYDVGSIETAPFSDFGVDLVLEVISIVLEGHFTA